MSSFKDRLITASLFISFLLALFALDDSYEDSVMSAQILDEAIAQAYAEQQTVKQELHKQQAKADF